MSILDHMRKLLVIRHAKSKTIAWLLMLICMAPQTNRLNAQSTDTTSVVTYYDAGIPTVNKVWIGSDYINAVTAIQKLAIIDPQKLPRKKTGNAKEIFSKIVDINGYQLFDSTYYTLPMQFQFSADALKAVRNLLALYYSKNGTSAQIKCSNEIADCTIAMLFLLEKQIDIIFKIVGDTSKLNDVQRNGFKQVKKGFNTVISGMLMTIEKEYSRYERLDIQSMTTYFFPFYKRLLKILDADDVIEFNKTITTIKLTHEYKEIKDLANK